MAISPGDRRLGRDVALKILRVDMRSDPDNRCRFEQNHPNVVAVFRAALVLNPNNPQIRSNLPLAMSKQ
jgi:hypothetical protein